MLIGFIIGGFIFIITVMYFVVLFLWPEWVGVSGRDHQQTLADQQEQQPDNQLSTKSEPKK